MLRYGCQVENGLRKEMMEKVTPVKLLHSS